MHGSTSGEPDHADLLDKLLTAVYMTQLKRSHEMVYFRGRPWITAQPFVAPARLPGAVRRRVPNSTESHTLRR
jgi:hypothetical protein